MRKTSLLIIASLITAGLTACGDKESEVGANTAENNQDNLESEDQINDSNLEREENGTSQYPLTISHELGEITLEKKPENVVVFDFGVVDILRDIEVDVQAVPQANVPSYLSEFKSEDYENAGTLFEPDFEAIYGMEPDLIIISGRAADAYDDLTEIAPTLHVAVDTGDYMTSFKENVQLIGEIFDKEDVTDAKLESIESDLDALHELTDNTTARGLILMTSEGELSAYGPGSRFGIIHDDFGVPAADEGIDEANHGMNVSFEYVLETNPEYIFVMDRGAVVSPGEGESAAETLANDLVMNTTAYKEDQIVELNPEYWYISAGGLTSVSGMILDIKAAFE
ncbi:siderophore ABC transporter substrate-binding protein [Salisediminibacterium beveridgei]|uniref:Putative iron compound ABC uptake transporter, substrate-binding protein n=1 Tax=Salisediminibacterium beveridgei TaxID=632773 RepID=A0A1D7QXK3_9BACI|nr:siderophore ABC transporter substrate-binding protein [Salisediminibacterium beveridgei]AOM83741.1 putative iron compound ABC uptake transporter, substrate-binding protein [Salisediminibacterium beveridgei]